MFFFEVSPDEKFQQAKNQGTPPEGRRLHPHPAFAAGIQMAPPRDSICTQRPFFAPGRTRFGPFCVVVNTGGRCPIHLRQYRTQELKGPGTCQMLPSRLASEASWCPPCIARGRSHHGSTPTQLAGDRVICVRSSGSVWIKNQEPALPVASGFRTSLLCTVHLGLGFFLIQLFTPSSWPTR